MATSGEQRSGGAGARTVFRSQIARVGAYLWFGLAAANLVDILVRGSGQSGRVAFAVLVDISVLVYVFAFRPAVVVDENRVLLRNPLRDVDVSWSALTGVDSTDVLRLHTTGGIYRSFAVQVGNRARARQQRRARASQQLSSGSSPSVPDDVQAAVAGRTHADFVVEQITERWQRAGAAPTGSARVRWHLPGLVALAVAVVLLVVTIAAG